jgi:hypothetical protein
MIDYQKMLVMIGYQKINYDLEIFFSKYFI